KSLHAQAFEDFLDLVVIADGNATRGDHHIRASRGPQRALDFRGIITRRPEIAHDAARVADLSGQSVSIAAANLSGNKRLARIQELVPGHEDGDLRSLRDRDLRVSE